MQTVPCAGRMLKIRYLKRRVSIVKNLTSDGRTSDVKYSTFDWGPFKCQKSDIPQTPFRYRIFDIRSDALRMSNIRHSTVRPIESNLPHSIRQNAHVYWKCANRFNFYILSFHSKFSSVSLEDTFHKTDFPFTKHDFQYKDILCRKVNFETVSSQIQCPLFFASCIDFVCKSSRET